MKKKILMVLTIFLASISIIHLSSCKKKHTHTYSRNWSYDEIYHWHEATCEHSSVVSNYEKHNMENEECTVCGYKLEHTHIINYVPAKAATCTEYGNIEYYYCTVCNITFNDSEYSTIINNTTIFPLGHDYSNWTIDIEPTESSVGERSKHCSRCDDRIEITEIPMLPYADGLEYSLNESGDSYSVVGIGIATDTNINITPIYNGLPVTKIKSDAFSICRNLLSVTIPDSVTSIENLAFYECKKLVEVYNLSDIPINIESSDYGYVGYYAKKIHSSLSEESIIYTTLDGYKFIFEDKIYLIGYSGTDTELVLPSYINGYTYEIMNYAFLNCSNVISIIVPDIVTKIGSYAFEGCSKLTRIIIGNSVTDIGSNIFDGCNNLANIKVYPNNKVYDSRKNCNAIIETETNTLVVGCQNTIIPDSVTSIGSSAFSGCNNLRNIVIPGNVISIGNYAFSDCKNLLSVTMENGVKYIYIYISAFSDCINLKNISIPDSVTTIGLSAFSNCANITTIIIPASVTMIGSGAFAWCEKLVEIYNFSNLPITIGSVDFGFIGYYAKKVHNKSSDESIIFTIENGYEFIYDSNTYYLIGYSGTETELVLPNDINGYSYKIKNYAFYGNNDVTSIKISDGVTDIGEFAFSNCSKLRSVSISDSVTNIGNSAFDSCSNLVKIEIGNSVTTIGEFAFCNCTRLNNITIPDSVVSIAEGTFDGCSNLTNVILGDSVKTIGEDSFCDCHSLTTIIIPASVNIIEDYAFDGCANLESIYYKSTSEQWDKIEIGIDNFYLTKATRFYYSKTEPKINSSGNYNGNYWHYDVNDVTPTIWKRDSQNIN